MYNSAFQIRSRPPLEIHCRFKKKHLITCSRLGEMVFQRARPSWRKEKNDHSSLGEWGTVVTPASTQSSGFKVYREALCKEGTKQKSKSHLAQLKMTFQKGPAVLADVNKRHLRPGPSASTPLVGEFPCRRAPLLFVFFLFPFRQGFSV